MSTDEQGARQLAALVEAVLVSVNDPDLLRGTDPLTRAEAECWARSDARLRLSRQGLVNWVRVGARTPDQLPDGPSVADVRRLAESRIPHPPGWIGALDVGWAGAAALCQRMIDAGHAAGRSPIEIVALFDALGQTIPDDDSPYCEDYPSAAGEAIEVGVRYCLWTEGCVATALAAAATLSDVDWAAAAECLRAGMDAAEAREYLLSGGDMEPVRVMAGLLGKN